MRCSGGRAAQFLGFIGVSHAAPLNAGVRHLRTRSSQCSTPPRFGGHSLIAAGCRAQKPWVRFTAKIEGAACERGESGDATSN